MREQQSAGVREEQKGWRLGCVQDRRKGLSPLHPLSLPFRSISYVNSLTQEAEPQSKTEAALVTVEIHLVFYEAWNTAHH